VTASNSSRIFRRAAVTLAAILAEFACRVPAAADPPEFATTLADQTTINVTIYNGGYSLVHDRRRVPLAAGINRLAWRDVSAQIEPTSSLLQDLTDPGGASLVEQNFDFDTLSPAAIQAKFVGRDVIVVHRKPLPGQPIRETAKLLSNEDGLVLRYSDRIETSLSSDSSIVYPTLPGDLRDRPTLVLDIDGAKAGPQELDLGYLTNGLGWHAEYTGSISPDDTKLDLSGLVTLTNTSGTSYRDARLQLVAGAVNAPPPETPSGGATADIYAMPSRPVTQENFFEYHLYTLPHPTSILDNQTKQVGFLSAHAIPIVKTYELRGDSSYYSNADADLGEKLKVAVYVSFVNKDGDLGIPLPAGLMRFYKTDSGGTSQFLGADNIDHTPKNETVRVHLGDAFDVTANKKQSSFRLIDKCTSESSYLVTLANAKDEPVTVEVVEPIPGVWSIIASNLHHEKSSSETATWNVPVPANGSADLRYSARSQFCDPKH
jgi:hypothetical protein